jgi:hypothetical protein
LYDQTPAGACIFFPIGQKDVYIIICHIPCGRIKDHSSNQAYKIGYKEVALAAALYVHVSTTSSWNAYAAYRGRSETYLKEFRQNFVANKLLM